MRYHRRRMSVKEKGFSIHNSPPPKQAAAAADSDSSVDKSGQRVREMFRQIAPRYDAMNHLLSLNIDRWWRRVAVKRLPWQDESLARLPVLDVCTGTGDLALAIATRSQRDGVFSDVIGSDFCAAMLEIANEKNDAKSMGVSFLEADSQTLPFDDDVFAAVTVAFGLRNVADTDRGLREMTRVCAPGGRVIVLEFSRPRAPVIKQGYEFYFSKVLPRIGQSFAKNDKSAYEYLPASVSQFPDYERLTDKMQQAGLVDCQYHAMTFGTTTLYWGDKPR